MRKFYLLLFFFSFLLGIPVAVFSKIKTFGIPSVKNYSPSDMQCLPLNGAAKQDYYGIMYFGNKGGLVEFDGSTWKTWKVANGTTIRSLDIDAAGRVYVGAQGEMGYFEPTQNGGFRYISLIERIPLKERNVNDVWKTFILNDNVIFSDKQNIYIFNKKDHRFKKTITSNSTLGNEGSGWKVDNILYFWEESRGILQLIGDSLTTIRNGDFFIHKPIQSVITYGMDKLLVLSRDYGLYIYDKGVFTPWKVEPENELKKDKILSGLALPEDYYAITTIKNGIYILDTEGKLIQHLNRQKGLQSNRIHNLYCDEYMGVWATTPKGIDYIDLYSPITYFNEKNNVFGSGFASSLFNGKLFLGTDQGIFFTDYNKINNSFQSMEVPSGQIYSLDILEHNLFCGSYEGNAIIENGKGRLINRTPGCFVTKIINETLMIEGYHEGLMLIKKEKGNYISKKIKNFDESSRSFEMDHLGYLWVSHPYKGVFRLKFNAASDSVVEKRFYNKTKGLPSNTGNNVILIDDRLLVSSEKGLYQYNYSKDAFEPYNFFNNLFRNRYVRKIVEDRKGNLWYAVDNKVGVLLKLPNGNYVNHNISFKKIWGTLVKGSENFNAIDENNVIIGTQDNFVHYDPSVNIDYLKRFPAFIRRVENISVKDSVVFAGKLLDGTTLIDRGDKFNYSYNSLRFTYSTCYYNECEKNQYQYKLTGFDKNWSEWTEKTTKEYTNLPEGKYVFEVKAKNIYDVESTVSSYTFVIETPWYRTIYGYIGFLLGATGLIYGLIEFSLARLKRSNERLEKIVHERTRFIVEQKEEIESQKKEITDSINYSQRIQEAILPSVMDLSAKLENYFILFKPKDIVSGDFYWFNTTQTNGSKELIWIAAADCTGHGVPGALMSIIGIEKLNALSRSFNDPARLLRVLNRVIKKSLHQSQKEEATRDGLDIALCVLDMEKRLLKFSGANRPLIIVRKNAESPFIEEIRATKCAIAGFTPDDQEFAVHLRKFYPGDTLYLFSDGYADQFGGPNSKKLMSKNFKELLLSINNRSMADQEVILREYFDKWKGDNEQVDDVLIIGIRL